MTKYMYHLTPEKNLYPILQDGLCSGKSRSFASPKEHIKGCKRIYLGDNIFECLEQLNPRNFRNCKSVYYARYALLKVDIKGCQTDEDDAGYLYVLNSVPPHRIKLLNIIDLESKQIIGKRRQKRVKRFLQKWKDRQ